MMMNRKIKIKDNSKIEEPKMQVNQIDNLIEKDFRKREKLC
jgi:hypothetical protein